MPELKPVGAAGWLKDVNDNFDSLYIYYVEGIASA